MHRRIGPAVLACLLSTSAAAGTDYPMLFDKVWSTVDANFYDPGFHGADWKAIGARYRTELSGVKTDKEFEVLASAMLKEIGTSHLYLVPPQDSPASGAGIGIGFREMDGEVLVSEVTPLSDAGLRLGDKLLTPRTALAGPIGSEAKGRVDTCGGKERDFLAHRIAAFWPPQHPAFEWWSAKIAPDKTIGYIRIDRFDDGAAPLADRAMTELKDTSALIIDIRNNSGGNASGFRLASYFLKGEAPGFALFARPYLEKLGHKVTEADVLAAPKVTGAYTDAAIFAAVNAHKGAATFWSEDVGAMRYAKPVAILIGEDTASAAEGFAWAMRKVPGVTFIGHKTAGVLLSADRFALPGGWSLTVPVQGVWGGDGIDYLDRALSPDVSVKWTRADMCEGRDPDILAARKLLIR